MTKGVRARVRRDVQVQPAALAPGRRTASLQLAASEFNGQRYVAVTAAYYPETALMHGYVRV
eukprot:6107048-Pyramimonas_sp.AAC.2